jgi:endo-1,4-beta-xylanase
VTASPPQRPIGRTAQWTGGFQFSVNVTNSGSSAISGWTITWPYANGQTVTQAWNATVTQSGSNVTATNMSYNGTVAAGTGTSFGGLGSWNGTNNVPTLSCSTSGATTTTSGSTTTTSGSTTTTGSTTSTTKATTTTVASTTSTSKATTTTTAPTGSLPSSFEWSSSGPLISIKSDATHDSAAIKDPSAVYYNGRWYVFATVASSTGNYSMVTLNFTDWSEAGSASQTYLDTTPIGSGYRAAPEIFYFAPQKKWYLVYQTGNASYSTNTDISNPQGWTAPQNFYSSEPSIIQQNIGSGYWVDMSVTCDSVNCYLFSSDDNGHLYRSQTTVADFPNGFSQPVIALSASNPYDLFEASHVYKVEGTNEYLLMVECIGSDGLRYFRSWTSTSIGGTWAPLAATESDPLAGKANVTFSGTAWTNDISHGDILRAGYDQTLTIDPCKMQFLYQGKNPSSTASYNELPWQLGLLTQTNSSC